MRLTDIYQQPNHWTDWLMSRGMPREEAEDIIQDALVRIIEKNKTTRLSPDGDEFPSGLVSTSICWSYFNKVRSRVRRAKLEVGSTEDLFPRTTEEGGAWDSLYIDTKNDERLEQVDREATFEYVMDSFMRTEASKNVTGDLSTFLSGKTIPRHRFLRMVRSIQRHLKSKPALVFQEDLA